MAIGFLLLALTVACFASKSELPAPNEHGIIELTPSNWEKVVMNEKFDVVVEFYSPFCIYCQQLEPVWNELGEKFKKEDSVVISRIDYSKQENFIEGYMVRGVPTIMIFPAKSKTNPPAFNSQRTLNNFIQWIMDNVGHKVDVPVHHKSLPKPASNPGPVITVVGETWQEIVMDTKKHVFVNFFAPWCPYSQRLAPIWADLAKSLQSFQSLVIAEFDGTQNEVPGVNLHAFPTTTVYRAGDKQQFQYRGPTRSVQAYTEWLRATIPEAFNDHLGSEAEVKEKERVNQAVLDKHKGFDDAHLVPELKDDKFLEVTQQPKKNIVVLFYASWDEHKEEHLDVFDDIALDYQFVSSIEFYQMEASKSTVADVQTFPSIKIFPFARHTHGLHELRKQAAKGEITAVSQMSLLTQKAVEYQNALLHAEPEVHPSGQRHWRKLTSREREQVLTATTHRPTVNIPAEFDSIFQDVANVPAITFKGKDITIDNVKEFIQENSNPTKQDIVSALARTHPDVLKRVQPNTVETAHQTMIYKQDL